MNYDQFKFWEFNRQINPKHVNELKKKIKTDGYRPELRVLVTPLDNQVIPNKHIILDGQHRVMACIELGCTFTYEIIYDAITKSQIEKCIWDYNVSRSNLTFDSYLHMNRGLPHYANLIKLKEITKFPVTTLLTIYQSESLRQKKKIEHFSRGEFILTEYGSNKILNVNKVFNVFKEVQKPNFKGNENAYILAISSILSNCNVDVDLLCKKILTNHKMIEYRDRTSNTLILYAIYNKNNPNKLDIPANLNRI